MATWDSAFLARAESCFWLSYITFFVCVFWCVKLILHTKISVQKCILNVKLMRFFCASQLFCIRSWKADYPNCVQICSEISMKKKWDTQQKSKVVPRISATYYMAYFSSEKIHHVTIAVKNSLFGGPTCSCIIWFHWVQCNASLYLQHCRDHFPWRYRQIVRPILLNRGCPNKATLLKQISYAVISYYPLT